MQEIQITTHAIKGLSENDFILASKIDRNKSILIKKKFIDSFI
jgi:pterin-4a-carbinolamine dehydratase